MYTNILVATDGSTLATAAVDHAARLAATLGAALTIVTVTMQRQVFDPSELGWSVPSDISEQIRRASVEASKSILETAASRASEHGVTAATVHVEDQRAYSGVLATAERIAADLIVMASNGHRGIERLILGSQAQKVLTLSRAPVLIVK